MRWPPQARRFRIDGCATGARGQQFTDGPTTAGQPRLPARILPRRSASRCRPTSRRSEVIAGLGAARRPAISASVELVHAIVKWSDVLPASSSPNPTIRKVAKYAIPMTDGEFNTAFAGSPEGNTGGQADLSAPRRAALR